MRRLIRSSLYCVAAFGFLAGCPQREVAEVDPTPAKQEVKRIPVQLNRDVDILFVVDNSGSMIQEQASLAANFPGFIRILNNIEGGLPNVHIGVISPDVGAGNNGIEDCEGNGDNGLLQTTPRIAGCSPPSDLFIKDIAGEGEERITNYTGSLEETFSCIASLSNNPIDPRNPNLGCGFEQPLEAMRRALTSTPQNEGFLRKDAFLAVIIITDEDDCSTKDPSMFSTDNSDLNRLGPIDSFRCFEFGVECENDMNPRAPGPRTNCMPRQDSQYMYSVQEYVDALKTLKEDPRQIIVSGIIGNPIPVAVVSKDNGDPTLDPSCMSGSGEADPAVRLQAFLDQFPERSTSTTICNSDLSDALTQIATQLARVIGNPCLEGDIDLDPDTAGVQYDCSVSDVRFAGTDEQQESLIKNCDLSPGTLPCWRLNEDADACASTPTNLQLVIDRGDASVPTGTEVQARCVIR